MFTFFEYKPRTLTARVGVSWRSTEQTGYYADNGIDSGSMNMFELAHRHYPDSVEVDELLEHRTRVNGDYETLGWATVLMFGAGDVADSVGHWGWDRDARDLGWQIRKSLAGSIDGGSWHLTVTGADPAVVSPDNLGLDTTRYRRLKLRLRNASAATSGNVYFLTDQSPDLGANAVGFALTPDDPVDRDYVVDLAAHPNDRGKLTSLRIDLVEGVVAGRINLDDIRLLADP